MKKTGAIKRLPLLSNTGLGKEKKKGKAGNKNFGG